MLADNQHVADQEQIQRLKTSVPEWNQWRSENLDIAIDLISADLSGMNLQHAYLTGANMTEANMRRADLSEADL